MRQRNEEEVHKKFCQTVQYAKEAYYSEVYDAPEFDINKLLKSRRRQILKRVGQIAAVFLLFIGSSFFFAHEFLSDTGYGKYLIQKNISSMSSLDIKTERLGDGESLSVVHIDDEMQLDAFSEFMGKELVLGYMPEKYVFEVCDGHKAENFYTMLYQYKSNDLYMDIDVEDIDYNGKIHIRGELVETLGNGDKIYGENIDGDTYTVTKIIEEDIVIIIDGNDDYNEAIKIAEKAEIQSVQ